MWKKNIFIILFIIFCWYIYIQYENFKNIKISVNNFIIHKWDNLDNVIKQVCKKKIINNCFNFKMYCFFNKTNLIKAWDYSFSWINLNNFFKRLKKWPKNKYIKFTILPWQTKFDIANKIKNKKIREKFLKLIITKKYIDKIKSTYKNLKQFGEINSLEWFLYPDTYFFKKTDLNSTFFPDLLIKISIKNFIQKTQKINWENDYNLSPYQILILASIVQKEDYNNKNRPYIANILIRRLKNNWNLWADWTLCYWLKVLSVNCKNYLYNKYLNNSNNKYNTRKNKWLPPTPVWNPTIDSIQAVLKPIKNKYWFYLHWNDGQIHYSKNIIEHNENIRKYLK